jgi:pimeloyl-ACP methyl ester carboxylesterase
MNGYAPVKDGELYYAADGEGHPLVLLHAGVADHTMWDEFIPVLSRRFRVIRYDARGFGRSRTEDTTYSNRQDLLDLLDHLGVDRAHVVGISRGGQIAIDFAVEHPERVSALVPVASGLGGMDWPEGFSDPASMAAEEAIEAAEAAGEWEKAAEMSGTLWADGPGQPVGRAPADIRERVRRWTLDTYTRQDGKAQPVPLDPPAIGRLAEIRVPTLVLVGDLDEKIVLIMADDIAEGIPGARKVVFENAAHMIPLEYPERFTELLLSFLP